ncbi:MAG: cache domain-containing protein, partial [Desulfobulbaceae bacterium]|nr:cache domain-containing protein [Desulfobulbaceae bacterium]
MTNNRQQSFGKLYQLSIFSTLALLFLTLGAFWVFHEYDSHLVDLDRMRNEHIKTNKQEILHQVNIHIEDARFKLSTIESQLRHNLQTETKNGWAIADNIYNSNKNTLSDTQIKKLIIEALMPMRFFNGRGYYWIVDTSPGYKLIAHPFRPDFIGKNHADLTDRKGQKFIRNFVKVAQKNDAGGFVSYFWTKPDVSDRLYLERGEKKIAFLKLFKPFGWVIGTGEYVHDVESQLQKEFLTRLNTVHYGNQGYISTYTFDGVCLSDPDKNNPNDIKMVQKIIRAGQQPGGGFIESVDAKTAENDNPTKKINYVNAFREWHWVLSAGFHLDDIDHQMTKFREDMLSDLYHRTLITAAIILATLALSYLLSQLFSKRLVRELELFSTFFKNAATNPEKINADQMTITEFSNLAHTANQMVEERQKFQTDLQQSKEVWVKSFNAISDLVTIHDKNLRVIRSNKAVCNFLNQRQEDIIGKHCHNIFQHNKGQCPNCPAQKTLADKLSHTAVIHFPKLQKIFQITTTPTFDDQDQLEYIVHVAKDISEQKRLEEELVQSQKMKAIGTLAGGIAHDFNNILTSLLGFADLAEEEARDSKTAHYIRQITTAGLRASDLVKQLLAFSRNTGDTPEHISLGHTALAALQLLQTTTPASVKIITNNMPTDETILANPAKINQIMVNLGTNALHAMAGQQGTMTINIARKELSSAEVADQSGINPGPFMLLTVTDTGHGINPDILDHIFDPYFTTKDVGKGIGMGLAVVHGIVKELGGFIKVESKINHGTTF